MCAASLGVSAAPRSIEINGKALDAAGWQTLRQIEAHIGTVPDGRYWYDTHSGAAGVRGGPASAYLGPGLALGGPLAADASGGGSAAVTGVFVNGRELHALDVQALSRLLPVQRGRYDQPRLRGIGAVAACVQRSGGGRQRTWRTAQVAMGQRHFGLGNDAARARQFLVCAKGPRRTA